MKNQIGEDQQSSTARRSSRLGIIMLERKLEDARRLVPEERLLRALDLSDLCMELQRACSEKHSQ
jgi:hypothetical protein